MTMRTRLPMLVLSFAAAVSSASAQDIQPFQAQEVKPYQAAEVKPVQPPAPARRDTPPQAQAAPAGAGELLGAWQSSVRGAVWTSPSSIPGWDKLHIAPGALAGLLVIYPNGNYVWNAYGGKAGKWTTSGDPDYPIVLDDRSENKRWKVGLDRASPGRIWIYDGNSISYSARRAGRAR